MRFYENVAEVLKKKKINLNISDIYDYQDLWLSWYRGSVPAFHYYKEVVAGKEVQKERLTMNMAKKNCEDIAKLLWTEKTKIELDTPEATQRLWNILDSKENSFTVNFPIFLEKSLAIGTGALIEYTNEQGKTIIDYVLGDVIIPYKYTNGYITGLITISRFTEKARNKTWYLTQITYHDYDGNVYKTTHELYRSDNQVELGKEINFNDRYPNIKQEAEVITDTPRFQIFKPNLANNIDINSPMGISIFANSIDRYKAIDMKFDSFFKEFKLGKKRILVDPTAMKASLTTDTDGNVHQVQYFDSNDEAYVGVNGMEGQPIKEIDFSLRAQEHIDSINADLNWLSSNLGLGGNFYQFSDRGLRTATEVISENAEAFRTKVHYDIVINDSIYDLVKVICEMENIPFKSITITPDDSIIEDKNTETLRALQEVAQGIRSKKSYLIDIKGFSEEQADTELEKIKTENSTILDELGV